MKPSADGQDRSIYPVRIGAGESGYDAAGKNNLVDSNLRYLTHTLSLTHN